MLRLAPVVRFRIATGEINPTLKVFWPHLPSLLMFRIGYYDLVKTCKWAVYVTVYAEWLVILCEAFRLIIHTTCHEP